MNGMGSRFPGGDKIRTNGLWYDTIEGRAREVGRRSFCKKVELTRNMSSIVAMCPIPVLLLLQVYFSFLNEMSSRSRSGIKSSIFSSKGSLTFVPRRFSHCELAVLKSLTMMRDFPCNSSFRLLISYQNVVLSL